MTTFQRILMIAALCAMAALPVARPAAAQSTLSPDDASAIRRIETYLNGLSTVQARFTQISEVGGVAQGTFYLSRPGRMRIEYDPPIPYLYIADGIWLTFWDSELGQRSDILQGSTLADFVTREDVRLSGDVTVAGLRDAGGSIEVDLVQTDDPGAGTLTLMFDTEPMAFRRWSVLDAQGLTTEIQLHDPVFGVALDRDLFIAPRPRRRPLQ